MRYIYLMRVDSDKYKIGIASDVRKRRSGVQTGSAGMVEIVVARQVDDALAAEKHLHSKYLDRRMPGGREWFGLSCAEALDVCVWIHNLPDPEVSEINEIKLLIEQQIKVEKKLSSRMNGLLDRINSSREHKNEELLEARLADEAKRAEEARALAQEYRKQRDEDIYAESIILIDQEGKASTSMIQRYFGIGYGRASRIMDRLQREGFVSPLAGSSAREVIESRIRQHVLTAESR